MCRWWLLALMLALAASTALAEPLQDPYRSCDLQTFDTAIAFERAGDREALRDHVRSYGCKLIWPREAFDSFGEPRDRRPSINPTK